MWKLLTRLIGNSIYKLWIVCGCAVFRQRMESGMFRRRLGETTYMDGINNSHDANGDTEEGSHKAKQFKKCRCPKRCLVVVFLVLMIIVANYMGIIGISSKLEYMLKLSDSVIKRRLVTTGGVAADNLECSQIGRDILLRHGSAVDAAIATLLCCHNINPHSSGIGGSSMMTIYDPNENKTIIINAKAISPSKGTHQIRLKIPVVGPLSIGIPGEIRGYWEAHQRYGKLPWKELFAPSIAMLEKGVAMTKDGVKSTDFLQDKLSNRFNGTLKDLFPDLSEIFCYENGETRQAGEIIHRLAYLQTLRKIAKHGADYLYSGEGAQFLISDLQKQGISI
ncbi:glutathione hydrolase 1 proenzyme [Patella vulgata]|uniref:glutathione hydrolase 1 proenzyme n=1 Tax=Patella vulgata TaxID=6465 RepID=UPI0024A8230E|nr:glutathione hydrolase 1 proenzyme [Patella vulgata]